MTLPLPHNTTTISAEFKQMFHVEIILLQLFIV